MKNKSLANFEKFQLSKEELKSISGGYDWKGRRQSCNVKYSGAEYLNEAFIMSLKCGGNQLDYITL